MTDKENKNERGVKCPTFDGKTEDFQGFMQKFQSFAAINDFRDMLSEGTARMRLPDKESDACVAPSLAEGKKAIKAVK